MKRINKFVKAKLVAPCRALLRQGIDPQKIAIAMAVGAVIGIFPVLGATTLIGTGIAILFRLNLPALHLANMAIYPLQLILLIPFFRFGAWMFGSEPPAITATELASMFENGVWSSARQLGGTTLMAIAAWSLISLPAVVGLYSLLGLILGRSKLLRKISGRRRFGTVPLASREGDPFDRP